ncbi:acetoacetate decarboxylase-like protein [Penicillium lagena]|uniref:acetoacetate decarboxylase-like protein n=1 Tax=Penicillium lagena TaxID=94218 RepID=UPI0025425D6F|nr:acetoacetate decarboxylase-like protein [Penicillium lagena]KAJ5604999.1 acetoacetate decarboxylase-like protein [Penicillium lagena]
MTSIQGAIPITKLHSIPVHAPPYGRGDTAPRFTGVDIVKIKYRTNGVSARELIPEQLSLEEHPTITTWVLDYGFSNIGPHKELIHQVEVMYQETKYDYSILLVLNNEDAVYGGREAYGYPKVLGDIDFDLKKEADVTAFVTATVSRPISNPIVRILFKPSNYVGSGPIPPPENVGLNLRLIPNIIPGAKPNVRQFVPITFQALEGEQWEGIGNIQFPSTSMFHPFHKTPVVEYLGAELLRNCTCAFQDSVTEVFDF